MGGTSAPPRRGWSPIAIATSAVPLDPLRGGAARFTGSQGWPRADAALVRRARHTSERFIDRPARAFAFNEEDGPDGFPNRARLLALTNKVQRPVAAGRRPIAEITSIEGIFFFNSNFFFHARLGGFGLSRLRVALAPPTFALQLGDGVVDFDIGPVVKLRRR